jgi:hypothetical protein
MIMQSGGEQDNGSEQDIRVQKDLRLLSSSLNGDNLDADIMFAKERGIRSCTPPLGAHPENGAAVNERLKRVHMPPSE